MAVFDGEMEALAVRKWPKTVMGDKRERERDVTCRMRKEEAIRVLVFGLNITDGFFISKNNSSENFIFQIPRKIHR